eukprot:5777465-Pyramimonas_sp.AAC.1
MGIAACRGCGRTSGRRARGGGRVGAGSGRGGGGGGRAGGSSGSARAGGVRAWLFTPRQAARRRCRTRDGAGSPAK